MKIKEQVYLLRKEFHVTPEIKRYVNIYLIVGKDCYLIDSGVAGTEKLIEDYLGTMGRTMKDIKGIFLTHSHPDHMGAAAEIKRQSGCKVYAPLPEVEWIENIQKQYEERPIPNFFGLLPEPVKVDRALTGGEKWKVEDGIELCALLTKGHSHGSMSYILNHEIIFVGDAIPVAKDLPIFVDYNDSVASLDKIQSLPGIAYFCPAWDKVYTKKELDEVVEDSRKMLCRLRQAAYRSFQDCGGVIRRETIMRILEDAQMLPYAGNPLIEKSIRACMDSF